MTLCVKADVKTFLSIPSSDTSRDTKIDALILGAQGAIEKYCNRIFEKAVVVEYSNGGKNIVHVKRPPINATPAPVIREDASREFGSSSIIDSDDYFFEDGGDSFFFDYNLEKGFGSIEISYTGGYTTIPEAIKQVCVEMVVRKLKMGDTGDIGVTTKTLPGGGVSISFSQEDILPDQKIVLNLYRKEPVEN